MIMPQDEPQALSSQQRERIYRRNFLFFLSDGILFSLGMALIGPTTVIPDFVRRLTSSEVLIGLSSSIFDVGWTLPQLFIARYIVRAERKKWWFIGPNIPMRFLMLIFAGLTVLLGKDQPGAILLAFIILYSTFAIGDGIVGVPWADLAGTSMDSRWRARMFGLMSAVAGVIMLLLSPLIGTVLGEGGPGFPNNYALLFASAGVLFALSILPVLFVHELPGGKAVEKIPSLGEYLPKLGRVLRTDGPFRAILITRMLTSLFAMASPFYIGFATVQLGLSSAVAVPTLLALQTVGSVSGAMLYTWLGARNNLLFIRLALAGAALLPISALIAAAVGPFPLYIGFLASGLTLSNLFIGFQNWVIGYATPDERPTYAGLFNTVSAFVSLLSPLIGGTIAQQLGYETLFGVALAMVLAALFVTLRFVRNTHPAVPAPAPAAD
ncbi:MAG: MFS transporter [Anaerolineae bacterium]|nr:MFS transporter [Anaerolineae bacterium]